MDVRQEAQARYRSRQPRVLTDPTPPKIWHLFQSFICSPVVGGWPPSQYCRSFIVVFCLPRFAFPVYRYPSVLFCLSCFRHTDASENLLFYYLRAIGNGILMCHLLTPRGGSPFAAVGCASNSMFSSWLLAARFIDRCAHILVESSVLHVHTKLRWRETGTYSASGGFVNSPRLSIAGLATFSGDGILISSWGPTQVLRVIRI